MNWLLLLLFYGVFLAIGIQAGRKHRLATGETEELLLAGRRLPLWLGALTLISTWVGGGYIAGTAEAVYDTQRGLLGTQAPWCFALSLLLGGLVFARPIRRAGLTTMLDLFQQRYGTRIAQVLFIPAVCGDLFWVAAILSSLGYALSTVVGLEPTTAIILSAAIAATYTFVGGLWSVAWTDALQLICILFGLSVVIWFAVPVLGGWEQVQSSYEQSHATTARLFPELNNLLTSDGLIWLDTAALLILGGIPWQVYFQRLLACSSDRAAVLLSIIAAVGCCALAVPAAVIGAVGSAADWSLFAQEAPQPELVLPMVLKHLVPPTIALVGLCALCAAVMSSVDSSFLSVSSMFVCNIYQPMSPKADARTQRRAFRFAVVIVACAAVAVSLSVTSVYTLWFLSADLVYVILFPQLVACLFDRRSNTSGAWAGIAVGATMRLLAGEPGLGIEPILSAATTMPHRTIAMLLHLTTIFVVSRLTKAKGN